MKLRRYIAITTISAALLASGAPAAFADTTPDCEYYKNCSEIKGKPITSGGIPFVANPADFIKSGFATWYGTGDAVARIDIDLAYFKGIGVNGKALRAGVDYSATSGSTVITLFESYLKTLPAGTYQFLADFNDSVTAVQVPLAFTVAGSGGGSSSADAAALPRHPATGPETILLSIGGLLLTGVGVTLSQTTKRRRAELV